MLFRSARPCSRSGRNRPSAYSQPMSAKFQGTCGGMLVSLCSLVWNGGPRTYPGTPAHTRTDFPHTPFFTARTYPAHIPKTPHTRSPTPHIPSRPAAHTPKSPHISPATPRKHVNLLARTYPRGPRTYPPVWRAVLGPPGGGPSDPPRAPWRAMGPIWGVGDMCGYVRGYVRPIKFSGFDLASFGGEGFGVLFWVSRYVSK